MLGCPGQITYRHRAKPLPVRAGSSFCPSALRWLTEGPGHGAGPRSRASWGKNTRPRFLWRRAHWPGRGCSTAQLAQKATNKPQGKQEPHRSPRTCGVPPSLRSRIPRRSWNSTACGHRWGPGQVRRASTACCNQVCPREAPPGSGRPLGRGWSACAGPPVARGPVLLLWRQGTVTTYRWAAPGAPLQDPAEELGKRCRAHRHLEASREQTRSPCPLCPRAPCSDGGAGARGEMPEAAAGLRDLPTEEGRGSAAHGSAHRGPGEAQPRLRPPAPPATRPHPALPLPPALAPTCSQRSPWHSPGIPGTQHEEEEEEAGGGRSPPHPPHAATAA